jgi:Ca2+-binding EF-hand superfamily protein
MTEHRSRSSPNNVASKAIDNLNPEELAELREAFRVFDQDGDVRRRIYQLFSLKSLSFREV